MSLVSAIKGVLVPLPAPGAPPSQINSLGNLRLSLPCFSSRSSQTAEKISWASLISRSATGFQGGPATTSSMGTSINHMGENHLPSFLETITSKSQDVRKNPEEK